jgi:hypothetical protein
MDESRTIRVSVEEAATLLGIEKGSVKKRVQRGKLHSEKDASGQTWVYLDESETVQDRSQGPSETYRDELVEELRSRVRFLEDQLEQANERDRENRRIVAALTSRIPELEAPQERPGGSETVEQEPEGAEPRPDTPGTQEGVRRPWWRRVFGG